MISQDSEFKIDLESPSGASTDVSGRLSLDGTGRVSYAVEQNLHEFRAGDFSGVFDNKDGFFDDLFSGLDTADRWRLRVSRRGVVFFYGIIIPTDDIHFDRRDFTVEITALDMSKLAEEIPADTVARAITLSLTAGAAAGTQILTLNSTAGLYNVDSLILRENFNEETVEIQLIKDATTVEVKAGLTNTYTTAAFVFLETPFYRYQTPAFLVNALLDALGSNIAGREIRITEYDSPIPLFSPASSNKLNSPVVPNGFLQKGGVHLVALGSTGFTQADPAGEWTSIGAGNNFIDWTPYRFYADGEPATHARSPIASNTNPYGVDLTPGALVVYEVFIPGGTPRNCNIQKYTSADGLTWVGPTFVATLGDAGVGNSMTHAFGDYDSNRNRVYYSWVSNVGTKEFAFWDVAGAAKTALDSTDQRRTLNLTANLRYSRDYDGIIVLNNTQGTIEIWRGSVRVVSRALDPEVIPLIHVKQARYFRGAWYMPCYKAKRGFLLYTEDDFATVYQIQMIDNASFNDAKVTIVNGSIRVMLLGGSPFGTRFFVGAPYFAGIIPYADFSGQSVANALDDLAVLMNAVFWIDQNAVAHFVVQQVGSGKDPVVLDPQKDVTERAEDPIWVETYDYVTVSSGGNDGEAGRKTSFSRNLSISTQIGVEGGIATSVAIFMWHFFSKRRKWDRVSLPDTEHLYELLDPIDLGGVRWFVHEISYALPVFEVELALVEDA